MKDVARIETIFAIRDPSHKSTDRCGGVAESGTRTAKSGRLFSILIPSSGQAARTYDRFVPTIQEIQAAGGWIIEDPAERHAASPETFWLPDNELRQSIRPGSRVQLIFWLLDEDDDSEAFPQVERVWLFVTRFDDSRGTGLLASRPVSALAPLELGQTLQFRADDTIDILDPEDEWEDERDALQAIFEGDEAFERWRDSKSES